MPLTQAFVGLGSNLGDRLHHLQQAIRLLEADGDLLIVQGSPIYQNRAVGMGDDAPDFFNAVVEVRTVLRSDVLLDRALSVENQMGRKRGEGWIPRVIDVDLLAFGDQCVVNDHLTLPHPRITERDFVLRPLADLAPELEVEGHSVSEHLERLTAVELELVDERLWPLSDVCAIAACSENHVIGRGGTLPWSIPEDWEIFLRKTLDGILIMGRLSFFEMIKEPTWQKRRTYIVLTSQQEKLKDYPVHCVDSLKEGLNVARRLNAQKHQVIWICGGGAIYDSTLEETEELHLTAVHREVEGDTFFPNWETRFCKEAASVSSEDLREAFTFRVLTP